MNGPFSKISEAIFLKMFLSSVVQKYSYMKEFIFNIICNIVMNTINIDSMSLRLSKLMLFLHLTELCLDLGTEGRQHQTGKFGSAFLFLLSRL